MWNLKQQSRGSEKGKEGKAKAKKAKLREGIHNFGSVLVPYIEATITSFCISKESWLSLEWGKLKLKRVKFMSSRYITQDKVMIIMTNEDD